MAAFFPLENLITNWSRSGLTQLKITFNHRMNQNPLLLYTTTQLLLDFEHFASLRTRKPLCSVKALRSGHNIKTTIP